MLVLTDGVGPAEVTTAGPLFGAMMYLNKRCGDCHHLKLEPPYKLVGLCFHPQHQLEPVCSLQSACEDFQARNPQLSLLKEGDVRERLRTV